MYPSRCAVNKYYTIAPFCGRHSCLTESVGIWGWLQVFNNGEWCLMENRIWGWVSIIKNQQSPSNANTLRQTPTHSLLLKARSVCAWWRIAFEGDSPWLKTCKHPQMPFPKRQHSPLLKALSDGERLCLVDRVGVWWKITFEGDFSPLLKTLSPSNAILHQTPTCSTKRQRSPLLKKLFALVSFY